jgi:hypothetical protein
MKIHTRHTLLRAATAAAIVCAAAVVLLPVAAAAYSSPSALGILDQVISSVRVR